MIAADLVPLAFAVDKLRLLPGNPRRGNVDAVKRSLQAFGQRKPIVVRRSDLVVIAGNHTLQAAQALGWAEVAVVWVDDDDTTSKAFALADNRTAELGDYDNEALAELIGEVGSVDPELLAATGWSADAVAELLAVLEPDVLPLVGDPDEVPEQVVGKSVPGDVWLLGSHRVMCGDSTSPTDVEKLMAGKVAVLLHADPPYGMGKENDGVLNDNLYASKLDQFQMEWWAACRRHIADNASAYVWGNPEDLWRLWYVGGLKDSERLTMRNEIVWVKPSGFGQSSELMRSYSPNTERCLFFMLGEQGFNNNADNYWDGWENVRVYLDTEMNKCGGRKNWKTALGNGMGSHYFTKSQWCFPTQEAYENLQAFGKGDAFNKDYDAFKQDYESLKRDYDALKQEFYSTRAFFDNAHDNMNEVWEFQKVSGAERYGHATPKPVEMISRAIKSSAPVGGLVLEPFGGSGSTLIAAHQTNRVAYLMELDPKYVDVICARFQKVTGIKAVSEATGREHNFLDG
jgi:DNA modification methylase